MALELRGLVRSCGKFIPVYLQNRVYGHKTWQSGDLS